MRVVLVLAIMFMLAALYFVREANSMFDAANVSSLRFSVAVTLASTCGLIGCVLWLVYEWLRLDHRNND